MKGEIRRFQDLFTELLSFEEKGVRIRLNNKPASPLQVVSAYMVQEGCSYMRDYDMTEKGEIKELNFCQI